MPSCSQHAETEADWLCSACGKYWCNQCAPEVKGVCKSYAFCPECRDFCEKLETENGRCES